MTLDSAGGGQTMQDVGTTLFHLTAETAALRKDSGLDQNQRNENKSTGRV